MAYNYSAFDAKDYDLAQFRGPAPGSKAPDFNVSLPDGTPARLLDFDTDFLVLEMGSITCPLFQGRRPGMAGIDQANSDATFAVLYVREAHPAANIAAHRNEADKRGCAARLISEGGETRRVLVDDIDGTAHAAYGGYPNSVFIINRAGCVVYFSDWNNPKTTGEALRRLKAGQPATVKAWFKPAPPSVGLRVLGQAGKGAKADFFRSLPRLIWNNLIRRNLRLLFGGQPVVAADAEC